MFSINMGDPSTSDAQMAVTLSANAAQMEQLLLMFRQWMGNRQTQNYLATEEHLIRAFDELVAALQAFMKEEAPHATAILSKMGVDESIEGGEEKTRPGTGGQILPHWSESDE